MCTSNWAISGKIDLLLFSPWSELSKKGKTPCRRLNDGLKKKKEEIHKLEGSEAAIVVTRVNE